MLGPKEVCGINGLAEPLFLILNDATITSY